MDSIGTSSIAADNFCKAIGKICAHHLPSKHKFFQDLRNTKSISDQSYEIMDKLYSNYQAAMHSSRVMGYFLPHLDFVDLRVQKLRILAEDDGIPGGDTHHYQLRRTWTELLGRPPSMHDEEFGDLGLLATKVEPHTADFIRTVQKIYPLSLGPWLIVEGLAHDWIGALMHGLSAHFPFAENSDYFVENFANQIEVRHAQTSLAMAAAVMSSNPGLVDQTLEGSQVMAEALDHLWNGLGNILS